MVVIWVQIPSDKIYFYSISLNGRVSFLHKDGRGSIPLLDNIINNNILVCSLKDRVLNCGFKDESSNLSKPSLLNGIAKWKGNGF